MRLRLPFVSRRQHERDLTDQARGYQVLIRCCEESHKKLAGRNAELAAQLRAALAELEKAQHGERSCASQLERVARELSYGKDVIATHMVAVGHPSTVLHSPQQCMESLREALAAVGFDLRLELGRMEGAEL